MQFRKRTTIVLVIFVTILFVVGSFASLIAVAETTQDSEGYSDSDRLPPLSEKTKTVEATQPNSMLTIELNANDRIILTVSLNGEVEYAKNESQLKHTFLLKEPGSWNITFRNDNEVITSYTYTIVLATNSPIIKYPAAGLQFPTFITAEILLCMLLPVNFYDNMRRMSKKTKETVLLCIIAFLALGFIPLLSLLTGTANPLFSPTSSSMEPTVAPGDLTIVTSVYPKTLQVGDILVYDKLMDNLQSAPSQISSPTMHRIARILVVDNQLFFVTKGDNNVDEDTWLVPEVGVIGKVIFIIPFIGNIFLLLSRIDVKIAVIVITVAIIALWPSKKTMAKIRGKSYGKENVPDN